MKIKILTEEAIDVLKETLVSSHGNHLLDPTPDYFLDYFEKNGWLKETKYEFPDIEFNYDSDYNVADPINVKALYTGLKDLSPAIASDGRLWAGLAFTYCWKFLQYRRHDKLVKGSERDKLNTFFLLIPNRRGCFVNILSTMWWMAHILYDEDNTDNPWEFVDYVASRAFPSTALLFSSDNLFSNPNLAKGTMQAVLDRYKAGFITTAKDRRFTIVESGKYLNCLGGISIIDSMSRKEAYELVTYYLANEYKTPDTRKKKRDDLD